MSNNHREARLPETKSANFDDAFKIMEYHHQSMRDRRSLGVKVLTAVIILCLLLAKGAADFGPSVGTCKDNFVLLMRVAFACISGLYFLFVLSMEIAHKHDRERYQYLEGYLWRMLEGESLGPVSDPSEPWLRTLAVSWAGTWPVLTVLLLSIGCWIFVGYI